MQRLEGKTALITGGTTGIGRATAELFIQHGARVAITGQDDKRVAEAAAALGPNAIGIRADVSVATDMDELARRLKAHFGQLDIVFANAGIAKPRALAEIDAAHIDEQLGVNVKGVLYTVQKTLPLLRKGASVILTALAAGLRLAAGVRRLSAPRTRFSGTGGTMPTAPRPQPAASHWPEKRSWLPVR